ncbi:hypothetical protein KJ612_02680, partial [Myxococcota bacterium]|nr:hypothetical protein [Myxococcota bacterium]
YEGGATEAAASVNDRPGVASAEVKLSDEACAYWEASSPGFCEPACELDQQCDATGTCRPMPQPVADLLLTLDTGEQTQTFEPQYAGTIYGTVTLPGRTFSATVTFSGLTVRLAPTTVPDSLADFTGVWLGTSSDPEGLDFAWTVPAAPEGSEVFTSIPINHHAGGPTHTECAVPSSAGAFSVAQEMLTPLAVITGLEFQGLQHVRFAAALTPKGCVEFRWQIYQQPTWAR